jgi:hypothetical protein
MSYPLQKSPMKIEKAYCKDCNEVIDAELAYDYYWHGKIHDKRNFECSSESCDTKITCANLDKLRQDMKVDPYFKSVGEHSNECALEKDIINKFKKAASQTESSSKYRNRKSNGIADIFILERPKSHWERKQTDILSRDVASQAERKRSIKRKAHASYFSPSRYFSVMSLVSKYFRLKKANKLYDTYINIKGFDISYNEMFIEIKDQNLASLPDYPRVYFGKAFVNLLSNGDYSINFANKFNLQGGLSRPSIYLSRKSIRDSFSKKVKEKKFEALSEKKYPSIWAFVYSKPLLKERNMGIYINFYLNNMDLFDFREKI